MFVYNNEIGVEGAKALAEALKINLTLPCFQLCKYVLLFILSIYYFS